MRKLNNDEDIIYVIEMNPKKKDSEFLSKEWWKEFEYLNKLSELNGILDEIEKRGMVYIKTDEDGKILEIYQKGKPTITGLNIAVPHNLSMKIADLNISHPYEKELFLANP